MIKLQIRWNEVILTRDLSLFLNIPVFYKSYVTFEKTKSGDNFYLYFCIFVIKLEKCYKLVYFSLASSVQEPLTNSDRTIVENTKN